MSISSKPPSIFLGIILFQNQLKKVRMVYIMEEKNGYVILE